MQIPATSSNPAVAASNAAPVSPPAAAANAAAGVRAVDGDYKIANAKSSHVKDADGDYKATAASGSATGRSSSAVQTALELLKTGG